MRVYQGYKKEKEDREKWNQHQGIRDATSVLGTRFLSDDNLVSQPPGLGSGHLWGTLTHSVQSPHKKPELLCKSKLHGFLPFMQWCCQGLSSWRSGDDWFLPISCVSPFGEKHCLDIFILHCIDTPIGWGDSAPSSHTLLFGIQHETAQSKVNCPGEKPCSLAIQKAYSPPHLLSAVQLAGNTSRPRKGMDERAE